jgi:hypothetical protein
MRWLFLILWFAFSLQLAAQDDIVPIGYVDTAILNHQKLQRAHGGTESVSNGQFPVRIFVFLSPECPISINYTKTLNEIAAKFTERVVITGIIPGKSYPLKDVEKFSREYQLRFNLYIDSHKKITELAKATITPEVIVFQQDGKIIYRGAIDDWAVAPGRKKQKAFNHYLQNAIEAHLQGRLIVLRKTKPVGCLINNY